MQGLHNQVNSYQEDCEQSETYYSSLATPTRCLTQQQFRMLRQRFYQMKGLDLLVSRQIWNRACQLDVMGRKTVRSSIDVTG